MKEREKYITNTKEIKSPCILSKIVDRFTVYLDFKKLLKWVNSG